jgi:DNA helicase-2/ATP-dependent DNA helicase PcrA
MTLVRSLFAKRSFVNYDEDLAAYYRLEANRIRKRHEGQKNLEVLLAQLRDEVDCLHYLIEDTAKDGPLSVERLEERTERTFGERDGEPSVVLSSVHRAKGKEANRVLILYPELMPASYARTPEAVRGEACVAFVALTRAKRDLVFVQAPPREPEVWDGP